MTSPWVAWSPGTNTVDLARHVAQQHDHFLSDAAEPPSVRDIVLASWRRSRMSGVDPDGSLALVDLTDDDLAAYRDAHPLAAVMPVVRQLLVDDAIDCDLLVAVSDCEGRLLWVEGAPGLRARAEGMNFVPGARWGESEAGTNAPGTALAIDHAVQIFAHEHYSRIVQPWSCSAAPIHDPVTGAILGVLDVTGGDVVASPQSLTLVQASVHAIESELRLNALRDSAQRRPRPIARSGYPDPSLEVLGKGHALLRRFGTVIELSHRHSELLFLLARAPAGLTTEQLAIALHDDDRSLVTIRAEMNRLRRILCELAPESRPYRLPMAVGSDVDTVLTHLRAGSLDRALDAYTGPILPHSEAPAIVRERRRLHDEIRAAVLCGDASDLFRWGESPWGSDDAEVWQSVVDRTASGSARHTLARLRLSALDEELAT